MLMVIFGAGASFDSSPTYTLGMAPPGAAGIDRDNDYNRPPLAKDLFANRPLFIDAVDAFPQCKTIVHRLRDPRVISGQIAIETLLWEIEQEATKYNRGPQELMAIRCYLQQAIGKTTALWLGTTRGITNYLSLLREIERTHTGDEPVCLVTFNYDVLLEHALSELGQAPDARAVTPSGDRERAGAPAKERRRPPRLWKAEANLPVLAKVRKGTGDRHDGH